MTSGAITGERGLRDAAGNARALFPGAPWRIVFVTLASFVASCAGVDNARGPVARIEIVTDDVDRFYALYVRSGGHPSVAQVQQDYFAQATPGLSHLTQVRNVNAQTLVQELSARPELYLRGRACLSVLPQVRNRLERAFGTLLALYPWAAKPPVTILVGRGKPLAIGGPEEGVQVALEAMCSASATRFLQQDLEDRFVTVIAHEYIHVQQRPERSGPTVLERAIEEGTAEFLGETISGGVANPAVHRSAAGREFQIETRFLADRESRDLRGWFDNSTSTDVGQLGYWVGYRIAKSYVLNAADQRRAIAELIQADDADRVLAASGWRPGVVLVERK